MLGRSSSTAWLLCAVFPIGVLVFTIAVDPLGAPRSASASSQTPEDDEVTMHHIRVRDARAQEVLQSILTYDDSPEARNPFRYRPGELYDASASVVVKIPTHGTQDFVVTSILGGKNPIALINAKAYRVGDELVNGWSVARIEPSSQAVVLVHTDGRERRITLRTHLGLN